jgi:pyruvate/2-oxoglutarate/acetoin dehydrogenase E1 component
MKYVEFINSKIRSVTQQENNLIMYGQNINAGSCLSGLTKGLDLDKNNQILNTQNSENTLTGIGFGLMLSGISSIYFMKQMDFLLLGIDHIVNTYNIIRQNEPKASFTIFPINVDSGYEGPQSGLNNINDFSSIAEVDCYSMTNKIDTESIINKYLVEPGFRIISPSQRLLRESVIDIDVIFKHEEFKYFEYIRGDDVSVICFNYSLPYGIELCDLLSDNGVHPSLFSVNTCLDFDCDNLIYNINKSKKLVLIDDSKSYNKSSDKFLNKIYQNCILDEVIILDRLNEKNKYYPRHDKMLISYQEVLSKVSC